MFAPDPAGTVHRSQAEVKRPAELYCDKVCRVLEGVFPQSGQDSQYKVFHLLLFVCVAVSHCKYSGFPAVSHDAPMKHGAVTLGLPFATHKVCILPRGYGACSACQPTVGCMLYRSSAIYAGRHKTSLSFRKSLVYKRYL